ncbi:hypothetical protein cypCar_00023459 [Cyprinus carpio]|nr:hypothetical protein cypCar_00023459 [Cyprinus carpio]
MVFVHVRTSMSLIEMAKNRGELSFFQVDQSLDYGQCEKQILQSFMKTCRTSLLFSPLRARSKGPNYGTSDKSLGLFVRIVSCFLHIPSNSFAWKPLTEDSPTKDKKMNWTEDFLLEFQQEGRPLERYVEEFLSVLHLITLGTVTNVDEAVRWRGYMYLYVQMRANPLGYGISHKAYQTFNKLFSAQKTEADILSIVSKAEEFEQIKNAARIVWALFEIALRKRWPAMTYRLLNLCKVIDKRLCGWAHPLRQFSALPSLVLSRIEERYLTVDKLRDIDKDEIGRSDARTLC